MLEIKNIKKQYKTGSFIQTALDDVSLNFRDNEFVSILGPSGSGKTTLLNIIGGLDKYDSGDIIINGVSTKDYKDRDWDSYRSHSVGFIFQSYNLIPHQTLLQNVELALTINNVPSSKERKRRAREALEKVGLGEHTHKKPNQLSGGQMQRVAIARALVNNPSIILADEPTGALDTKTSVQVMELLKEVAKDRLVIMVTHNPELAKQYSNRIVELRDGVLRSDSNPLIFDEGEEKAASKRTFGRVGMSLFTSMRLSFNNLLSKFKRTALVSVAGSIGIIGISLIMAVSNGANDYIQQMEEQALSEYPLAISKSAMDMSSMMTVSNDVMTIQDDDKVHEKQIIAGMFGTVKENNLKSLKAYIKNNPESINPFVNAIEYKYGVTPYIYQIKSDGNPRQVSPDSVMEKSGLNVFASLLAGQNTTFAPLPVDKTLYETQYEVVAGHWPENEYEVIVVLTPGNGLADLAIYNIGLKDPTEVDKMIESYSDGLATEKLELGTPGEWGYDEVLGKEFKIINAADLYTYDEQLESWTQTVDADAIKEIVMNGKTLKIVGIVRPLKDAATPILGQGVNYCPELIYSMIESAAQSKIVQEQLNNPDINVFTGKAFDDKSTDFDMSKLFNFDQSVFDEVFNFDTESVEFDTTSFDNINIGSFNLNNYISVESLAASLEGVTAQAISDIFRGVTVDVTPEKISAMFSDLYFDFLDSKGNASNMNIENLAPALREYLQTDGARQVIKESLQEVFQNSSTIVTSSAEFNSAVAEFIRGYISYVIAQELDPLDYTSVQFYMQTTEAQIVVNKIAEAASNAISGMIANSGLTDKILERLSNGYIDYATINNLPIVENIINEFLIYIQTERAVAVVLKHAECMIDMNMLRNNLNNVAVDIGTQVMNILTAQMSSAVGALGRIVGQQIEAAVTSAMTTYMEDLASGFNFSPETLKDVVDANMSAEKIKDILSNVLSTNQTNMKSNLKKLGYADMEDPDTITFYPKDFDSKNGVIEFLNKYNEKAKETDESSVINFTDMVGSLMSSVTNIIDIIGYVLIAFVSISLVVSSIMIGVITYISVLERRKEIGILRAMGASKRNITQVFNCETVITGFLAGTIGVCFTWLILIPTNIILQNVTGAETLHGFLPIESAVILVILSIILTTIGGLLPSRSAAKQDPVIALRSE